MSKYFPKPKYLATDVKVELDFPYYANTKADLKNETGVGTGLELITTLFINEYLQHFRL